MRAREAPYLFSFLRSDLSVITMLPSKLEYLQREVDYHPEFDSCGQTIPLSLRPSPINIESRYPKGV